MNRGVEIDSDVADGEHAVILDQVTNGVAVRMAVLFLLAGVDAAREAREEAEAGGTPPEATDGQAVSRSRRRARTAAAPAAEPA
jgi:hypothetical protein